jgi:hypothetical protein
VSLTTVLLVYYSPDFDELLMNKQLQTTPDPDFSPSIPAKPVPDSPKRPATTPPPEMPGDDELPIPPIFPTA